MKKRKALTNQDVRKVLDQQERARLDVHDLPMFQRDEPVKPAAPAPVIPRYRHK